MTHFIFCRRKDMILVTYLCYKFSFNSLSIFLFISLEEFLEDPDHAHLAVLLNHCRSTLKRGCSVIPTVVLLPICQ